MRHRQRDRLKLDRAPLDRSRSPNSKPRKGSRELVRIARRAHPRNG